MIYLHYCAHCQTLFMLNGHKFECPRCASPISELKITFEEYSLMMPSQREMLRQRLADPNVLLKVKSHYRFAKHTKRFQQKSTGL